MHMVCCVFQATNLVNNYRARKSARTLVSRREASNKLYTVLCFRYILRFALLNYMYLFSNSFLISSFRLLDVSLILSMRLKILKSPFVCI